MASSAAPDSQSATEGSNPSQAQGRQTGYAALPRTVRSEMTIPVSEPQKKLLSNNETVEEFYKKLQEHDIEIDSKSLHTDKIEVIQGDPMKAVMCLASVISTETIDFTAARRSRTESSLKDLHERFPTQFFAQISEDGRAEIAFLPSIKSEIEPELDELKYIKKLVPLSSYWLNFYKIRLPKFKSKMNSKLNPPVDLSISVNPSDQPLLQFKCEHGRFPQVERVLEENLTLLCYRQLEVSTSRAGYLQSSAGKEKVQSIEKDHHCTMQMETRYEKVLLEAQSPRGHQVRVCEGNMAATECAVIGLPVWEGQSQQASYECILQRGCLHMDLTYFLALVGSPPKGLIHDLRCQGLATGQKVIIMFIPLRSHDHFQELVSAAVKEALQFASKRGLALALPLKFRGDFSFDVICHVLTAVCDCCNDGGKLPPAVHFYLEPGEALPGGIGSFFQRKGWLAEVITDPAHQMFDQRVEVLIGDILNAKGDAVVNSSDPELKHKFGQVSRVFLDQLGDKLIQQCRQHYPKGMDEHIVGVTDALDLQQFQHMFHIVLPQQKWHVRSAPKLLLALRTCVEACLHQASAMGLSSLVLPALATGTLQYPPDLEAKTVLETTRQFFHHTPHTSLTRVTFVAYKKNPDVVKVFKAEETVYRYGLQHSEDSEKVERRFQVSKVLVQVVQGDALTRRCTAELLICANPPATGTLQNYQRQMGPGCEEATVDTNKVKNEVRDQLKRTTASSVQLNMQTFDAEHVDKIVEGIKKASAQTVQIIIIIVSSTDVFNRLCSKFESTSGYVSVAKRSDARSQDQALGHIGICGPVNSTKEAVTKVLNIEIPDTYIQAEKYNLHPSFLERTGYSSASIISLQASFAYPVADSGHSVAMATAAPPSEQAQEAVYSVPREQLRGINKDAIINKLEKCGVFVSFRREQVKFSTCERDAAQLTTCVQDILAMQGLAAQYADPSPGHSPAVPASSPAAVGGGESPGGWGGSGVLQSAGSLTIPSMLRMQQPSSSKDCDKNVAQSDEVGGHHDARQSAHSASSMHAPSGGDAGSRNTSRASGDEDHTEEAGSQDESATLAAAEEEAWAFFKRHYPERTGPLEAQSQPLRQEKVHLTPQELAVLGTSVDCLSAKIEAYVKVLPDPKVAVIIALDFNGISKAKHLVEMTCGRIKVRQSSIKGKADQTPAVQYSTRDTRSLKKVPVEEIQMEPTFFSRVNPGQAPERAAAAVAGSRKSRERQFRTGKGLKVWVYPGDITVIQVDGIVSAANEQLTHQGGVAAAIATAAGQKLRDESNEYIAQNGPLKVGDVVVTTSGDLPCQHVLHALGPRWADYRDKMLCQQHLTDTVFSCLMKAHSLKLTSLAVCSVSSGIFGVPQDTCAESYLEAVRNFDAKHGDDTSLQNIQFVDTNSDVVDVIQGAFADHWR